jgi:integrase
MSDYVPKYRKKKTASGPRAVVTLPDGVGGRRDVQLGPWRSKESRLEYARVIGEWEAAGRSLPRSVADAEKDLTINELVALFRPHVEQHYRHADGTPTGEVDDFRLSLKPLRALFGDTCTKDFGPLALKAIREQMIVQPITTGTNDGPKLLRVGLARGVINQRINRIRRLFRWAVENELVPGEVLFRLEAVKGLAAGRSEARETAPVRPVSDALVEETLPHLTPTVADIVRIQRLTGMRCGEVVIMRGCDLDTTGAIWLYRPDHHKTKHRGHDRVVALPRPAQQIIKRYLKTDTTAYLFSPRESMEAHRAKLREERLQGPHAHIQPSQVERPRKRKPKRAPRDHYDSRAIAQPSPAPASSTDSNRGTHISCGTAGQARFSAKLDSMPFAPPWDRNRSRSRRCTRSRTLPPRQQWRRGWGRRVHMVYGSESPQQRIATAANRDRPKTHFSLARLLSFDAAFFLLKSPFSC